MILRIWLGYDCFLFTQMTILLKDISFLCTQMTAFCYLQCIRPIISSNFLSLLHVINYFSFSSFCFITCQVKARFVSFSTMFSFLFILFYLFTRYNLLFFFFLFVFYLSGESWACFILHNV